MAWLEVPSDEPRVEQVQTPVTSAAGSVPASATASAAASTADEFPDNEAPTALRKRPPRVPGALRTLPPMPLNSVPTKPPPPPRRHTQEVEMSWVELVDDDLIEEPASGDLPPSVTPSTPPSVKPSVKPSARPSVTSSTADLPKLYEDDDEPEPREVTRVESAPVSTQRIEAEKAVVLAEAQAQSHLEGPPISDTMREARAKEAQATAKHPAVDEAKLAAEAAKKERLSQFLQAVSASQSIVPGALKVSELTSPVTVSEASDADLDQMREEALAARKREQDARDREILARRRAERERERLEEEAKQARRAQEKREEEERAAAIRHGTQDKELLDLSGIDDEIDDALDALLGPNLSYPPPPPPPSSSSSSSSSSPSSPSNDDAAKDETK